VVGDAALVRTPEPAGLDPGVGEVALAIAAEQEDATDGGHLASLVIRHEAESLEIAAGDPADGRERLGSGSEIQRFRVEVRQARARVDPHGQDMGAPPG